MGGGGAEGGGGGVGVVGKGLKRDGSVTGEGGRGSDTAKKRDVFYGPPLARMFF